MSHFTTMKSVIRDVNALKTGAERLGLKIEVGNNLTVRGYHGDKQKVNGAVIKLNTYDVGFHKTPDGTFEILTDRWGLANHENISDYKAWEQSLTQAYNVAVNRKVAEKKGYRVVGEEVLEDGSIKLRIKVR